MADILSDRDIAEIEARAEKATPGPWLAAARFSMHGWPVVQAGVGRLICNLSHIGHSMLSAEEKAYNAQSFANAALIAHARTDIPALIASHRALLERLAAAEADAQTALDWKNRAQARIEALKVELANNAWISVKDRLPPVNELVDVWVIPPLWDLEHPSGHRIADVRYGGPKRGWLHNGDYIAGRWFLDYERGRAFDPLDTTEHATRVIYWRPMPEPPMKQSGDPPQPTEK